MSVCMCVTNTYIKYNCNKRYTMLPNSIIQICLQPTQHRILSHRLFKVKVYLQSTTRVCFGFGFDFGYAMYDVVTCEHTHFKTCRYRHHHRHHHCRLIELLKENIWKFPMICFCYIHTYIHTYTLGVCIHTYICILPQSLSKLNFCLTSLLTNAPLPYCV